MNFFLSQEIMSCRHDISHALIKDYDSSLFFAYLLLKAININEQEAKQERMIQKDSHIVSYKKNQLALKALRF